MTNKKGIKKKEPKWFKGPTSEDDKLMFRKALANYLAKNFDGSKAYPKADVKLYISVLKELAKLLPRWSKVNEDNFSTHHWDAHAAYATTLRNLLITKHKLNAMVEEARADLEQTESDEEAEEELIEDFHEVQKNDATDNQIPQGVASGQSVPVGAVDQAPIQ